MYRIEGIYCIVGYVQNRRNILYSRICSKYMYIMLDNCTKKPVIKYDMTEYIVNCKDFID